MLLFLMLIEIKIIPRCAKSIIPIIKKPIFRAKNYGFELLRIEIL